MKAHFKMIEGTKEMVSIGQGIRWVLNRSVWLFVLIAIVFAVSVNFKKAAQQRSRYLLGVFYNESLNNYNDGIVYFDYLAHQRPKDGRNYFFLGYCYLYLQQYDKASAYFERALQWLPDDALTKQYLAYSKSKADKDGKEVELPAGTIQIPLE